VKVERVAGTVRFLRRPTESDIADLFQAVIGLAVVALWALILWR
jgi:hypothetical protein